MQLTVAKIMTDDGQLLPFARDLREALSVYARRKWPSNTSGNAARAWGVSKDTATNLLKGHASDATVSKVLRAGGWEVALPVIGAVIGEPVHEFFRQQFHEAAKANERAQEHERRATAAHRRLADDLLGGDRAARSGAASVGEAGDVAGGLRAPSARRVGG